MLASTICPAQCFSRTILWQKKTSWKPSESGGLRGRDTHTTTWSLCGSSSCAPSDKAARTHECNWDNYKRRIWRSYQQKGEAINLYIELWKITCATACFNTTKFMSVQNLPGWHGLSAAPFLLPWLSLSPSPGPFPFPSPLFFLFPCLSPSLLSSPCLSPCLSPFLSPSLSLFLFPCPSPSPFPSLSPSPFPSLSLFLFFLFLFLPLLLLLLTFLFLSVLLLCLLLVSLLVFLLVPLFVLLLFLLFLSLLL